MLYFAIWTQTVGEVRFGVLGDVGFHVLPGAALVADAFAPHASRQPSPEHFDFPGLVGRAGDEKRHQDKDGGPDERIGEVRGQAASEKYFMKNAVAAYKTVDRNR